MYHRIMRIGTMAILGIALIAWEWSHSGSPYTGTYTKQTLSYGVKSKARFIRWNTSDLASIKNNLLNEYFDQTADCTVNSPVGDKLYPDFVYTTLPNLGALAYNDCGGPLPDVFEEVELELATQSLVAENNYTYDVTWACNSSTAQSGEINITFEQGTFAVKDWLDKVTYSWSTCVVLDAPPSRTVTGVFPIPAATASSARDLLETKLDDSGVFGYQVLRTTDGSLRARALVDFLDPGKFMNYQRINMDLAKTLIPTENPLLVTVTFAFPLPLDEVRMLAEETGLTVLSYGAVGTDAAARQVSVYRWPQTQTIEELPNIEGVHLDGVMTMSGLVRSGASTLSRLYRDERILLVDLIANQIRARIEAETGQQIDLTQIGVPNPAWFVAAGMIELP